MAKFYIKIASLILLFVGSVIAGFCIMPNMEQVLSSKEESAASKGAGSSSMSDGELIAEVTESDVKSVSESEAEAESENEPTTEDPASPTVDADTVATTPAVEIEQTSKVASQPQIESVEFPPFEYWKVPISGKTKIGYRVTVRAKTESGDGLKYDITTSSGKQYSSTNGVFDDVYPTNDGKFTVVVTNTRTGEQAQCEKSGLVKNPKLTASQMESQLTNNLSRMFYFYFAADVKFKCYGAAITEDSVPDTLHDVVEAASMGGLSIDVKDATIKYNEWNRITYFEIEIN